MKSNQPEQLDLQTDPQALTQPVIPPPAIPPHPMDAWQPVVIKAAPPPVMPPANKPPRRKKSGCLRWLLLLLLILPVYLLLPTKVTFLLLGIDRAPEGTDLSRSDTMVVASVQPLTPKVRLLSIPRDLWVNISPEVGENRINTAHFFAEGNQPGSGPKAALQVVNDNFDLNVKYYLRIRFDGVKDIVDAMGGVQITLDQPTGIYPAGSHTLDGTQALAFVRDRSAGDDFFRMAYGQMMIKAMISHMLKPANWLRIPAVIAAFNRSVDSNLPVWEYPRLALAFARAINGGMDARTITRDMVTPWVTSGGAQVLLPNWDLILPTVKEMFP